MRFAHCILIAALFLPLAGVQAADTEPERSKPHNALERRLLAVQQGEDDIQVFLDQLVDSKVVLLSKKDVVEVKKPGDISPLVIPTKDGKDDEMVAVFTSPPMAQRVAKTYPEYRYGIQTDFIWVLAHTAPGLGLAINPGWTLGLRIPSYGVLRLRERYAERIQAEN